MTLCCFIPGKIIDEVLCILKLVDTTNRPLRAHEVLQELRDISSMAIDHFDEKIAPILKKSFCELSSQKFGSNFYQSKSPVLSVFIVPNFVDGSVLQSPMDTVMPDFSTDIFQVRPQQPDDTTIRCQDSQKNQMAIVRMERKYDIMQKKVRLKRIHRAIHLNSFADYVSLPPVLAKSPITYKAQNILKFILKILSHRNISSSAIFYFFVWSVVLLIRFENFLIFFFSIYPYCLDFTFWISSDISLSNR